MNKNNDLLLKITDLAINKFANNIILSLIGARVCYSAKDIYGIIEEFNNDKKDYITNLLIKLANYKHYSVFAHSMQYFDLFLVLNKNDALVNYTVHILMQNNIKEKIYQLALDNFKSIYDYRANAYMIGLSLRHFLEFIDKNENTEIKKENFLKAIIDKVDFDNINKYLILDAQDNVILVAKNNEYKEYYTFYITCSRACSHQIVRHTILNFSQRSQRYVLEQKRKDEYIILNDYIPDSIKNNTEIYNKYINALQKVNELYKEFVTNHKIPAEDARYLLTNSKYTNLLISGTKEQFLDFISKRNTNEAQKEIRTIAQNMHALIKKH